MTREKIISLAKECGCGEMYYGIDMTEGMSFYNHEQLEAFYKAIQNEAFEAAASRCDVLGNNGAGGFTCAAAIREMVKEMK